MCYGFRNTSRSVAEYLFDVNDKLKEILKAELDVIEVKLVHRSVLHILIYICMY